MVAEECNTKLGLAIGGVGGGGGGEQHHQLPRQRKRPAVVQFDELLLRPKEEITEEKSVSELRKNNGGAFKDREDSPATSVGADASRKKLRLTKEQSALLEESFREHTTLNSTQKQGLAAKLNLSSRQVEVWFQNRRARTKLKQTEVDLELLKKSCENLSDENRRLRKELQELRAAAAKSGQVPLPLPYYKNLHSAVTAALVLCPSCEHTAAGGGKSSAATMAC